MEIKPAWIPHVHCPPQYSFSKQCQFGRLLSTAVRFHMLTVKGVLARQMKIKKLIQEQKKERQETGLKRSLTVLLYLLTQPVPHQKNTAACAVHHAMIGLQVVRQPMVRIPCASPLLSPRQERGPAHEHPGSFLSKMLILTTCLMFNQRARLRGKQKGTILFPRDFFVSLEHKRCIICLLSLSASTL